MKSTKEKQAEILAHFGIRLQLNQLTEECAELIASINRYYRGRITMDEMVKEIADVKNMVEQMEMFFGTESIETFKRDQVDKTYKKIKVDELNKVVKK